MKEGVFPEDRSGVLAGGQWCLEELPPRSRAWGSLSPVAGGPWGKAQDEATALGQSRHTSSFGEPSAGAGRLAGPMCVDAGGKRGPWEGESPVRGCCSTARGTSPRGHLLSPSPSLRPHLPGWSSWPQLGSVEVRWVSCGPGLLHGLGGGTAVEEESGSRRWGRGAHLPTMGSTGVSDPEQGQERERKARGAGLQQGCNAPGGHRVC